MMVLSKIQKDKLIHTLVREYLRNAKLITTLEQIGFDGTFYRLNLIETIVKLMGFRDVSDSICDVIEDFEQRTIVSVVHEIPESLDELAQEMIKEIYNSETNN